MTLVRKIGYIIDCSSKSWWRCFDNWNTCVHRELRKEAYMHEYTQTVRSHLQQHVTLVVQQFFLACAANHPDHSVGDVLGQSCTHVTKWRVGVDGRTNKFSGWSCNQRATGEMSTLIWHHRWCNDIVFMIPTRWMMQRHPTTWQARNRDPKPWA